MGFAREPAVEALRRARGALPEAVQLLLDAREGRQLTPEPHGALRPAVVRSCSGDALRDGHFADQAHRSPVHRAHAHKMNMRMHMHMRAHACTCVHMHVRA